MAFVPPAGGQPLVPMQVPQGVIRLGEGCLWSTYQYADATVLQRFSAEVFGARIGDTSQGFGAAMGLPETNLRTPGMVPGGYALDVHAIALQPYYASCAPVAFADLQNLQANMVLQWNFQQTYIDIAPGSLVGGGGGIFGTTADTGDAQGNRSSLNNGAGQLWAYRLHPVQLPSQLVFGILQLWGPNAIAVQGGAGNSALNVRVVLIGRYQTAIDVA